MSIWFIILGGLSAVLRRFVTKKHLTFYFLSIVITWLEAIITPALIQYIVSSFTNRQLHLLWQILLWGIGGNLVLVLGLAGKRYYYARQIAERKSLANQNYIAHITNMIAGAGPIRHYQGQHLFFKRFSQDLDQALQEEVCYEKQRSLNSLFINGIDAFCSVAPIVIGGFMTYQNYLSAASFVGIYLVSHNIGYQFQELSYFINTRKSAQSLCDKYQDLLKDKLTTETTFDQPVFPIQLEHISVERDGEIILAPCDLTIHAGEKIAIIGESGAGKTTLLNVLYGEIQPSQGRIR